MERLRNTIEWIKFGIKDFGKDETYLILRAEQIILSQIVRYMEHKSISDYTKEQREKANRILRVIDSLINPKHISYVNKRNKHRFVDFDVNSETAKRCYYDEKLWALYHKLREHYLIDIWI